MMMMMMMTMMMMMIGVWVSIESVELTQPGRLPGLGFRSGQVEDYSRVWQF